MLDAKYNDYQRSEITFYLANLFEEKGSLKKSYKMYAGLLNNHPNPTVVKYRLEKIIERKKVEKR